MKGREGRKPHYRGMEICCSEGVTATPWIGVGWGGDVILTSLFPDELLGTSGKFPRA